MINFHTHALWSDGELLPAELARRAEYLGYKALAITDHADFSNLEILIPRICNVCQKLRGSLNIQIIPGVELTHLPPGDIAQAAKEARLLGAQIVVVHGETIVEPVMPGTNLRALESEINILAHPSLITEDEIKLAKEGGGRAYHPERPFAYQWSYSSMCNQVWSAAYFKYRFTFSFRSY